VKDNAAKVPAEFSRQFQARLKNRPRSDELDKLLRRPSLGHAAEETSFNFWDSGGFLDARHQQRRDLRRKLKSGIEGARESAATCRWLATIYKLPEESERAGMLEGVAQHLEGVLAKFPSLPKVKRIGVGKSYAALAAFSEQVLAETGVRASYETLTDLLNLGRPEGTKPIGAGLVRKNIQNFRHRNPALVERIRAYYLALHANAKPQSTGE
jgi:hypothetical protein